MNILLIFPGFIVAFIIVFYYKRKIRRIERNKNKVHFYVARDKNGELWLYIGKPFRDDTQFCPSERKGVFALTRYLFKSFGLNKKDYANLKWEDEPIEVFVNMED